MALENAVCSKSGCSAASISMTKIIIVFIELKVQSCSVMADNATSERHMSTPMARTKLLVNYVLFSQVLTRTAALTIGAAVRVGHGRAGRLHEEHAGAAGRRGPARPRAPAAHELRRRRLHRAVCAR